MRDDVKGNGHGNVHQQRCIALAHQHAVARVQVVDLRGPIGGPLLQPRDRQHLAVRAGVNLSTQRLAVRQRRRCGAALLDRGTEAEAVFERAREGPSIAGAGREGFSETVALCIYCPVHHRGLRTPQHGQRLPRAQVHSRHASAGFARGSVGRGAHVYARPSSRAIGEAVDERKLLDPRVLHRLALGH